MSCTLRALLLVLSASICAEAQTRTLALYAEVAHELNAESGLIMRAELQRLLTPAGLEVAWKSFADRKSGEDFELVVLISFQGSCQADERVLTTPMNAVSLADTAVSDGHILPFFKVDCPQLVRMLGTQLAPAVFGRALARIIAHEIYHIVARTAEHQERGVAKAAFSLRDLTADRFELDAWSLARMRPPSLSRPSESSSASAGR